jgi:hypothetical protein
MIRCMTVSTMAVEKANVSMPSAASIGPTSRQGDLRVGSDQGLLRAQPKWPTKVAQWLCQAMAGYAFETPTAIESPVSPRFSRHFGNSRRLRSRGPSIAVRFSQNLFIYILVPAGKRPKRTGPLSKPIQNGRR